MEYAMPKIISDPLRVLKFVQRYSQVLASEGMKGIGLEEDGELIAGVVYENYTGSSIWMHVAAVPGRRWLNRAYLYVCFSYPFLQLGVDRIFGWVPADNSEAQRFDEHLGFKQVTTIPSAGADGGDVLIYRMERADCRYLSQRYSEHFDGK
jgi:RimJ/RimL family protein N-acetyltransferase